MSIQDIHIKGAREHNLQNVEVELPCNQLICFTGVSGSGKSSLAFDTLYAEGQRRYVESLSSYARQFLGQMPKPDVDFITHLRPAISIAQKTTGQNPRSTVGTITEIYDYLRVLYSRVGTGYCPHCGRKITAQTRPQILAQIQMLPEETKLLLLAPRVRGQKGEFKDLFRDLLRQGFLRARVDGQVVKLTEELRLDRQLRHNIDIVVDRITLHPEVQSRLAEAVESALHIGNNSLIVAPDLEAEQEPFEEMMLSSEYACTECQLGFEPPSPQLFSFNSPQGMCLECNGLGEIYTFDPERLIPNPQKSFRRGAVATVGLWDDLGRWKHVQYRCVAEYLARTYPQYQMTYKSVLDTQWRKLPEEMQEGLLYGTGNANIAFSWRNTTAGSNLGGTFEGIIPQLLSTYRTTNSRIQKRYLEKFMNVCTCGFCKGERLNPQARSVKIRSCSDKKELSLPELGWLPISEVIQFFRELDLDATGKFIAKDILHEIRNRLGFLADVGLEYLSLSRTAPTLSGGELQRIRLASQIGSGLVGVLYILDEPSIGLHPRDNNRLLGTLKHLRDLGNTVVVVEHDEDTMRFADKIIDFGPGAGVHGGNVVVEGSIQDILNSEESLTGQFLSGRRSIPVVKTPREGTGEKLVIRGAAHHNLKHIDVEFPLGKFICVTGVSGSGKSSLINGVLKEILHRDLNHGIGTPGAYDSIEGLEHLNKMISIDQSPIGRTPRSNPATYIKLFDEIRMMFAELPESKQRGFKPGRFSFNVDGGRCEACQGYGATKLEMDFLADVWVTCPVCGGKRFNYETLQVLFKGHSIADVLEMDVQQAMELFENVPRVYQKLLTLHSVGLDYMKIGQPSPTLSGGEAQRVKLARELVKISTGRTMYILDEPTTGLHFADIEQLLKVLHNFADAGNTVVVVEHNLDVVKTADWIIDLGLEGGNAGGEVVVCGTPKDVVKNKRSYTAAALKKMLIPPAQRNTEEAIEAQKLEVERMLSISKENSDENQDSKGKKGSVPTSLASAAASEAENEEKHPNCIHVEDASQHNLKHISLDIPRDALTVCCGPSGSGKSSLAMDTVYAEGQRRYVESLSSYARQFVGQMQKPHVERIEGLAPAIAIEQKRMSQSPRSTVGTVTEIYDYLRILMARLGTPYCPDCQIPIGSQTTDEIVARVMKHPAGTRLMLLASREITIGHRYETLWEELRRSGFVRVRIDGMIYNLDDVPEIDRLRKHDVEVVVDRIEIRNDKKNRSRIAESIEQTLDMGNGTMIVLEVDDFKPQTRWKSKTHSLHNVCDQCGRSFETLAPNNFSFNTALGWCPTCEGLGVQNGVNPNLLLRNPKWTLSEGAIAIWTPSAGPIAAEMMKSFCTEMEVPMDVPYEDLAPRFRKILQRGTGERWFQVDAEAFQFRFQFKGLMSVVEETSRLVPALRHKLESNIDDVPCAECGGSRLRDDAAAVRLRGKTIDEICELPLSRLLEELSGWKLTASERKIAGEILREIKNRTQFLLDVGLEYLTLSRPAPTLSGGEMQRIRLAAQVGSGLCGVLYVLDEPTIGLHPRDNMRLIKTLRKLRDLGNTLLVVEHDRDVLENADKLIDFGPNAGRWGGEIMGEGTPAEIKRNPNSLTGNYLSGTRAIPIPSNRHLLPALTSDSVLDSTLGSASNFVSGSTLGSASDFASDESGGSEYWDDEEYTDASDRLSASSGTVAQQWIEILGARQNNLKNINVRIPLGTFTVVSGVSGSGKSSLVEDILYNTLARQLHRAGTIPGLHTVIRGIHNVNKVIEVDQRPIGTTPSSNPATYTGVFDCIRELFAQLPDSKMRGFTARRFSFNVPGGRCEKCEGNGQIKIEMHFLPDVWVTCDECKGQRYEPETLMVRYKGYSISDVLNLTCAEALELFRGIPNIRRILQTLCDVGLDYITLGQPAPTLSGGEAQRVKLASELSRPDTGKTLYILDEPTTGLHFSDLVKLLDVLHRLVDMGNTVVVIEHNLDVIKSADWLIELGPEAGTNGGQLVVEGTPEDVVMYALRAKKSLKTKNPLPRSYTGEFLAPILKNDPHEERKIFDVDAFRKTEISKSNDLEDAASEEFQSPVKMPWEVDGIRWHSQARSTRCRAAVPAHGEILPPTSPIPLRNPAHWDVRIFDALLDRLEMMDDVDVDWNDRNVIRAVSILRSNTKFLHMYTNDEWLLKLSFRVAKETFKTADLVKRLNLRPLNEFPELPVYGTSPRVRVTDNKDGFQDVEMRVHFWSEFNTPEMWKFFEEAQEGFRALVRLAEDSPEDLKPWKTQGRKWHESPNGFLGGVQRQWKLELFETIVEAVERIAPEAVWGWQNKVVVPVTPPGFSSSWARITTKKGDAIYFELFNPKNMYPFDHIGMYGFEPEIDSRYPGFDCLRFRFRDLNDWKKADFVRFLEEHYHHVVESEK